MPESLLPFKNGFSKLEVKMNGHYSQKIRFLLESVCLMSVKNHCGIVLRI